jgi:hypothetical protein
MISAASEAKIVDLENIPEKTLDLIQDSVDIENYMLPEISNHHSKTELDDAVLEPFIRDYPEYVQKGRLELGNINSQAIQQALLDLKPSDPLGKEFPAWLALIKLYVWAADPEAGAWERICGRVNVVRQSMTCPSCP